MRPLKIFLAAFLFAATNLFSQTIYKVDSNPNAPLGEHVYSDLQECINNATDGDIIQVIPASTDYGTVTIDKELHLVGAGLVPDNQSGMNSKIYQIVFGANADNSSLNGLVLTNIYDFGVVFGINGAAVDTIENVEVKNCKSSGIIQNTNLVLKNATFRNNIFSDLKKYYSWEKVSLRFQVGDGMTENLVISNNIIAPGYNVQTYPSSNVSAANQTIIANNIIWGNDGNNSYTGKSPAFYNLKNCIVSNNVFFGTEPTGSTSYGNVFSNNLSFYCGSACEFPPPSTDVPSNVGSNNLSDQNPLYTSLGLASFWSISYNLEVPDDSPLIGAGSDGTDIGLMGGQYPFINYKNLRGVPYIHQMSVAGLIIENQDIQLEAEARNNQ
ncbi:MAG: hypothetical protein DRI54_00435 [Bacteroidetes bacterium]|nr:MAG: hypothetical protein DRI54_00435 [Bacteroidota bacterium]